MPGVTHPWGLPVDSAKATILCRPQLMLMHMTKLPRLGHRSPPAPQVGGAIPARLWSGLAILVSTGAHSLPAPPAQSASPQRLCHSRVLRPAQGRAPSCEWPLQSHAAGRSCICCGLRLHLVLLWAGPAILGHDLSCFMRRTVARQHMSLCMHYCITAGHQTRRLKLPAARCTSPARLCIAAWAHASQSSTCKTRQQGTTHDGKGLRQPLIMCI